MAIQKTLSGFACLLLSACMVGPDYKEPKISVAAHWINKDAAIKEVPAHHVAWWNEFHDPNLTALIQQGYHNNISVQIAGAHVLQARAQLAQSVGGLYPQQQAIIGNYTYNRIGGGSLQGLLPQVFKTALMGFTATWEIDFWGKYRRAILSNNATFLASVAAYDHALVSLTADVATTYINIRMNQALIRVTQQNIAVQQMALKLAKSRYQAGQIGLVDVEQAQAELSETQSALPTYISALQKQKDMLAVLLGIVPSAVDMLLSPHRGIPVAPRQVGVSIPKEALARRPDIHQARLEAIAQSEAIGAAKANLYPSFSLTGTFAFAANTIDGNSISQMFNWNNRTITAGPTLNWPILNYGQMTNSVRVQDAAFQQAVLSYVNLVLQAQQEVQDNITRYIEGRKSEQYLIQANRAAIQTTRLTMVRYREGESDFTPVLNAEQQQLRIQTSLVKTQAEVPLALVALYRALGGGWQIRCGNDIVPRQLKQEMAARTDWGNLLAPQNHLPPTSATETIKQLYLPSW